MQRLSYRPGPIWPPVLLSGGKPWQARPPVEFEQLLADP